jgi:thiamine pyrophosphokinase
LIRHIRACNTFEPSSGWLRLLLEGEPVGWITDSTAARLQAAGGRRAGPLVDVDPPVLARVVPDMVAAGLILDRREAFDIRGDRDGRVLGRIDRGAMPALGLPVHNAHLNGLVRRAEGLHLWVARRAAHKPVAPGKLDHLVAGGVPAGLSPREALVKEAAEEAGMPAEVAARAAAVSRIRYAMAGPDGLRRETMHCFDLDVPDSFAPAPVDGEVAAFELWPLPRVMQAVRDADEFMYDVNLALIDLGLRHGLLRGAEAATLRHALAAEPP